MTDDKKPGFGPQSKLEGMYDEHISQWVLIDYSNGNKCYSGKMIEIKEGSQAILSPFVGTDWDETGHSRVMKEGRLSVCLLGANVEPTTEESINHYLEDQKRNKDKKEKENNGKGTIITP
jgi:hypothetical protein